MKTFKPSILSTAVFVVLTGCGGGSSSSQPSLEGAFTGSFSNGVQLTNLILADGSFWSVYGPNADDLQSFSNGHLTSDEGKFTVSFINYAKPGNKAVPGDGSGTYTKTAMAGSVKSGNKTLTFTATGIPTKNYNYDTPATIASVVGKWSGKLLSNEDGTITILDSGIFSGSASGGCTFTGKFSPTDNNLFDVSVTFGGTPCAFPGEPAKGVGLTILRDDGKHQLTVAVVNASKNAGSLFYAKR